MKKLFIAAILTIAVATSVIAAVKDNSRVEAFFKAAYPGATQVHYKTVGEMISVTFQLNNHTMQAFYNSDAEKIAESKVIDFSSLPVNSQNTIGKRFAQYTVSEVIEMNHAEEGRFYFVSLLNNTEKIVAQVSLSGAVSVFKKVKR